MPPKLIPAISGAETTHFDTMFWKGVTEKKLVKKKTVPKTGSIGVFWHLYKDLSVLGTDAIAKQKINKIYPRAPEDGASCGTTGSSMLGTNGSEHGKVITAVNAKALKAFYEWSQQTTDPLFFIKKGTQPLWLCRKIGTYYYEDKPDDPFWYPHRIGFEFVRFATETEGVKRLGIGMNTMIWIELAEEIPKQETPIPAEMPPKKTTTKTVTAAKTTERKIENAPKKRPGRKPKTTTVIPETVVEPLVLQESIQATYVETEEEPLEVEMIKVQPFELDGTDYYREPIKNKLYKRLTGGGIGPYIGRYSSKDEKVHEEIEDSDREEGF